MLKKNLKFKNFLALVLSFAFCLAYFVLPRSAYAQTLSLSPATATKSAGLEFDVDLRIDIGTKSASAADVKLTFDPAVLQISDVQEGTFFSQVSHNIYSGILYIGGSFTDPAQSASGSGKFATITLKGKAAGTSQLAFVCSNQSTDTNIFDTSSTPKDIILCSTLKNGSYTITGGTTGLGGGAEESLTPTPEPPVSGVSWPTIFSLAFGLALAVLGLVIVF